MTDVFSGGAAHHRVDMRKAGSTWVSVGWMVFCLSACGAKGNVESVEAGPDRPDGTNPHDAVPDRAVLDGAVPDGAVPDGAVLDGAVPDGAVPDGAVLDGAVPDGAVLDGAVPDGAVPDRAVPDGAVQSADAGVEAGVDSLPVSYPQPCPDIYDDALLPKFEITISPQNLAKLQDLYTNHAKLVAADPTIDLKQYIDAEMFRYGDETYTGVQIRLKGTHTYSWTPASPKMQLVIKFAKEQLFHGVRRLNLDSPWYDPSLLRERMAMHFAHDVGLVASCANNAVLNINGAYYALYANIEFIDERFLRRNFPDRTGNLWKNGEFDSTGKVAIPQLEEGTDNGDVNVLNATADIPTLETIGDLDQWVSEWAAEAVMPNGDGYSCVGHNWLTYHDPIRGWQWIMSDADATFGWNTSGPDADPISCSGYMFKLGPTTHFDVLLADAKYAAKYRAALTSHLSKYDVTLFQNRIDAWNAQIKTAADTDPHKMPSTFVNAKGATVTPGERDPDVAKLRAFFGERRKFLETFLAPGP